MALVAHDTITVAFVARMRREGHLPVLPLLTTLACFAALWGIFSESVVLVVALLRT